MHILLHFGTNLAARIDGMTISGVAGVYITCHICHRKIPMVELMTLNKHYREVARIFQKKVLLKREHVVGLYAPSGILCH